MNSSPLFMSVAESTEILRPMTQFGCAQASSGVTRVEARAIGVEERPARSGQQDALHARAAHRRGARSAAGTGTPRCVRCRWAAAWRPTARTVCMSSGPAMTSDSLLANNRRLPARAAASVERRPAAPTMAAMTLSHFGQRRDLHQRIRAADAPASAPRARAARFRACGRGGASASAAYGTAKRRHCSASFSALRCAPSATTRKRSGMARDHIERGFAHRAGGTQDGDAVHATLHGMTLQADEREHQRRRRGSDAVDAIEHAAVTGEQRCRCP